MVKKRARYYPKGNTIAKQYLLPVFEKYSEVEVIKVTSPMKIRFGDYIYDIYLKCVGGGGDSDVYTDNQTRAQLDSNKEFDDIKASNDRFLFLGFDIENDVFVCWDPVVIKSRLNKKNNVGIWSRKSFQENATQGEIRKYQIPRNPDLVTFRRTDIVSFLEMIEVHFPNLETPSIHHQKNNATNTEENILDSIDADLAIKLFVDEKIAQNTATTMIVNKVMGEFCTKYPFMKYGDWSRKIRAYLEKVRSEEE